MPNQTQITTWDRIMMAITFAEANEHQTARDLITGKDQTLRPETRKEPAKRPELRA